MARKRTRGLSAEDKRLWSLVVETAKPLGERSKFVPENSLDKDMIASPVQPVQRSFEIAGSRGPLPLTHSSKIGDITQQFGAQSVDMDAKAFRRMKAGKLRPEGKIDLHGMTLAQAHPLLNHFILDAYDDQKRLVLIVTGKGKNRDDDSPIPTRTGVLRHQVPQWLRQFPLGQCVLQISQANQRHGGAGAYYVYLKRRR